MKTSNFERHQGHLIRWLESSYGVHTRICDDMLELVSTYAALSETGYVQLPFKLERSSEAPSPHFWVSLAHEGQTIALVGIRVMSNENESAQTCAAFLSNDGLYPRQGSKPEGYLKERGPMLAPHDRFAYLGAGWVHPCWRGHNFAGYLSRIAYDEVALRTECTLAFMSALTFEAMYTMGLNLRAACWHHMRAQLVLDGYLAALDRDVRMYLSHSTMAEQAALYERELEFLDDDEAIPWLREHDKTPTPSILAALD